jgi:hypothetical protein
MSMAKRQLELAQEAQVWAEKLLLHTGALSRCPDHNDQILDNGDDDAVEQAKALARAQPFQGMTPDEAAEFIDEAMTEYGEECPDCDRWRRE